MAIGLLLLNKKKIIRYHKKINAFKEKAVKTVWGLKGCIITATQKGDKEGRRHRKRHSGIS